MEKYDWFPMYEDAKEEFPHGMPTPKRKPVNTSGFFDTSHACCHQTQHSMIFVLLFLSKTPVLWFAKRQNTVESSTFGSQCDTEKITVNLFIAILKVGCPIGMLVADAKEFEEALVPSTEVQQDQDQHVSSLASFPIVKLI